MSLPSRLEASRVFQVATVAIRRRKTRVLRTAGLLLVGATMVLAATPATPVAAATGINKQISFQGKVVNTNGTNVANGSYSFTFKLYSQQAPGGTAVWTETKSLTVTDGVFQTQLGDTTALPGSVDFTQDQIFLGMAFNSDPEMTPRIQFTAAAYAFQADNSTKLGGITAAGFAQLNPSSAQSGSLNVTGSVQAATSLQAPLVDTTTAVALNVGTATASSVTVGRATSSNTVTIQGSNASTWVVTGAAGTSTLAFAAPSGNTTTTISAAGGTVCTTVATTCSATYQAASATGYLLKNAADTSSASTVGTLLGLTNSNTGAAGVLSLTNAGTSSALSITQSANPTSGQALILANNTAGTPSGNLIDLQVGGASKFSVDATGNIVAASANISGTLNAPELRATTHVLTPRVDRIVPVAASGVAIGDVVIQDATGKMATTTTARDVRVYGVSIQAANTGSVQVTAQGPTTVNVDTSAVAIGDQLVTSATAGQATVDNTATTGIIGTAVTAKAGGSTGTVTVNVRTVTGVINPNFQAGNITTTGTISSGLINGQTISAAANFTGTVTAATSLLAPLLDTASAGVLAIGTNNATQINLNQNTVLAAGKSLTTSNAAATGTVLSSQVTGDSNPRFTLGADGKLSFGSGSVAPSISIQRLSGGSLQATGTFLATRFGAGSTGSNPTATGTFGTNTATTVGVQIFGNTSQSADLLQLQDISSAVLSSFGANGQLTLGRSAASGTLQNGTLTLVDGSNTSGFSSTISTGALTSNQTISLGNQSGTICLTSTCLAGSAANYIQNTTTQQATSNFNISNTGVAGVALQAPTFDTATASALNIGTTNASSIALRKDTNVSGVFTVKPNSDVLTTPQFKVQSSTGNNALTVATSSSLVQVGIGLGGTNAPTLTGNGLQVGGALQLSGGSGVNTDNFLTPVGSSVSTKINIPLYDPGAFGQLVAMGLPSTASTSARVLSLFDARTAAHQPTLGVFSPNENNLVGFSWEGTNTDAYLKTTGSNIILRSGTTDLLTALSGGNVGVGVSPSYKFDVNGDINVGSGSVYRANGVAGTTATCSSGQVLSNQTTAGGIVTGGTCATSATTSYVTLQNAYNNSTNPEITVNATNGALTVRDASTAIGANLFEVQNNGGTTNYFAVTANGAQTTGTLGASTAVQAPSFDTATATGLSIGTGNQNALTIGKSTSAFTLQGSSTSTIKATNGSFTTTVGFTAPTVARTVTFGDEGGTVCLQASANCGFVVGSTNTFIQNNPGSQQTGSFNIVSGAATTIAANIQGAASATVPVLQLKLGATPQTGSGYLQLRDSANSLVVQVDQFANLSTSSKLTAGSSTGGAAMINSLDLTTGATSFLAKGQASKTGDYIDLQNSGNYSVLHVTAAGTIASGDSASIATGSVSLLTGNATGTTTNSGNLTVDTGTATGTTGTITVGNGNASSILIGRSGAVTTIAASSLVVGSGNINTANQSAANSNNLTLKSGNVTGGSGLTTGSASLTSGDGSGTNTSSGNVTIDAGSKTGTGFAGNLNIGTANTPNITLGRSAATVTIQGSSASTTVISSGGFTNTVAYAAPTANVTTTFSAAGGTVCTTVATTCSSAYQAAGSYLAKNAADTSTASTAGYLLGLTNSSGGALQLSAGGTTAALSVTQTANPAAGQAVILANNTNGTPTGNLIDLQAASVSKFSVSAAGNLQLSGNINTIGGLGLNDNSGTAKLAISTNLIGQRTNVTSGSADIAQFQNNGTTVAKVDINGNLTGGTLNGQTISSTANFTGTITAAGQVSVTSGGIAVTGTSSITGALNVTAAVSAATGVITPQVNSADTATATTPSAALVIRSGNATGATSGSGNVTIDAGTATGTAGTLNLGTSNAAAINIGNANAPVSVQGSAGSKLQFGNTTINAAASVTAATYQFAAPTSATTYTICTTDSTSCSNAYLRKNVVGEQSSAGVGAGQFLYQFANTGSASGDVLQVSSGSGTGNAIKVTAAANPAAGNALLYAKLTNAAISGNLLDLWSGASGSETSKFSVSAAGAVTSGTINGQTIAATSQLAIVNTSGLLTANSLTVTGASNLSTTTVGGLLTASAGASVTGGLNNNAGGITGAGSVAGVTGVTFSSAGNIDASAATAINIGTTTASGITVGRSGGSLSLQGAAASTTWAATAAGFTTTVGFVAPTATIAYQFGNATAGTYQVCSTYASTCGTTYASYYANGYIQLAPAVAQADASTNNSIFINKTAAGNLLKLQNSGTDVFSVQTNGTMTSSGLAYLGGTSTSYGLQVDTTNFKVRVGTGTPTQGAGASNAAEGLYVSGTTELAGLVFIGDNTNNAQFNASTKEVSFNGSARHAKNIKLTAEYAGAVLDASGANNTGTMTAAFDATQRMGYYKWTTGQATAQNYDIVATIPVPDDWSAWNGNPVIKDYISAAGETVTATITRTDGTIDTGWNGLAITPGTAATWNSYSSTALNGTGYAAGGTITVRIRVTASTNQDVRIGDISIPYLSRY